VNRPTYTKEIIAEGCKIWAQESGRKYTDSQINDVVENYSRFDDGYELAKKLEDNAYWNIDACMVEELDCIPCSIDSAYRKACKKWVEENNIQPPLPIGTKTQYGIITSICDHSPGCYRIQEPDKPETQKIIIKFEDVVEVTDE
jgi:hypothetical protein